MGKTVSTLTAVSELMHDRFEVKKCLVIAPLRVAKDTWAREANKWDHLQYLKLSKILGSADERKAGLKAQADIYIINRENVPWLVELYQRKWPFDMVVIDESSSFKSPTAKRFRALRKVRPLISRMVELTGTPSPNGLLDLWPQIYLLDRGERLGKTMGEFKRTYFNPGARNGHIVYEWKPTPEAEGQIKKKLSDICYSMSAEDWLDLPDRIDNFVWIDLNGHRKKYKDLEKDMIIELEGEDIFAVNAAVLAGKLLQLANGAVYDTEGGVRILHDLKLEALESIVEESGNMIVYYSFKHDLKRIKEQFPKARVLDTEKDIEDWNSGKISMLLAHPASSGHGLNLQDGGHTVCWFGLPWSLELYQQANARLHRQGQTKSVIVHHILARDTMDTIVMKALAGKDSTQADLLEALKARVKEVAH